MNGIKLVIAGVDGSRPSLIAADWAADWCADYGTPLRLLTITRTRPTTWEVGHHPASAPEKRAEVAVELAEIRDALAARHRQVAVTSEVLIGVPAEELIAASRAGALVVIGGTGSGGALSALIGGVASGVLAHAPGPIIVVPAAKDRATKSEIVVAIDPHAPGLAAVRFAADAALRLGVRLRSVSTVDHQEQVKAATRTVQEILAGQVERQPGLQFDSRVLVGPPAEVLAMETADSRLLVLGARHRGALAELLLGSTSKRLVRDARLATAVVPNTATD